MKFTASSLSMLGYKEPFMKKIDPRIGIEIFYEWGSPASWDHLLRDAMQGRTGGFSIHSPFTFADVAQPDKEDLFDQWREPFDLYHRYQGEFYVVHSQGRQVPGINTPKARYEMQMLVKERLAEFSEICHANGIRMVVENLFCIPGEPLFSQEEYIKLFEDIPRIDCLIDVGHAILGHYNVAEIQKIMKNRLVGYHIHDNNGEADFHWRIGRGIYNWKEFMQGVREYTPEAVLVMEYNEAEAEDYRTDMEKLLALI